MTQYSLWDRPLATQDIWAVFTPDDSALSRGEIARRLGVKKNARLIIKLNEMVEKGHLKQSTVTLRNGVQAFVYERT